MAARIFSALTVQASFTARAGTGTDASADGLRVTLSLATDSASDVGVGCSLTANVESANADIAGSGTSTICLGRSKRSRGTRRVTPKRWRASWVCQRRRGWRWRQWTWRQWRLAEAEAEAKAEAEAEAEAAEAEQSQRPWFRGLSPPASGLREPASATDDEADAALGRLEDDAGTETACALLSRL